MSDQRHESSNPFEPTGSTPPPPPPPPASSGSEHTAYSTPATPPPPPPGATHPPQAHQPYGGQPTVTSLAPETEKQISALSHGIGAAATFFSGGTLGFVACLIMYFVYRDRGPFVRANVANALNMQIMIGIGLVISGILMFVLIGLITYPIIWVLGIVFHIIGAVKAMNGEWWKPPMTPDFVK